MAISFSRPDPSSPAAVGSAAFPVNRRGFDQGEVRDFLRMVAAELARLQERERFLESELRSLQTRGMSTPGRLDEETVTTLLGEEAARVLSTARDASTQIRDRAEESATRLVKDAAEDAARIREAAHLEAARIHEDAVRDAEQEIEMAKQQGRDMVNEARAYREKVLSELSRRRDAARDQIEQLLHGRDRLLNAFERARLASEDVINGLTEAHDEPEFIVDLTPTTGPVPVVNPEHPSVKPFDHEQEDREEETARVTESEAAPVGESAPMSVISIDDDIVEVVVDDVAVEDAVIEDVVEGLVENVHELPVVVEDAPRVEAHPVESAPAPAIPMDDEDDTQTNVVSLFGRNRKSFDLPEVQPEVAPMLEEEIADESVHVEVVEDAPAGRDPHAVDDIFARLRESTTGDVAKAAAAETPSNKIDSPAPVAEKSPAPVRVAADPSVFAERDEALSQMIVSMSRKMKRVLADEQNEVLQHLKLKKSSLEMEAFLSDVAGHAARYVAAITDEMMAAAGAGAKSVKESGGSSRRVTNKAITEFVTATVVDGFVAGFREDARVAIGEAEGDRALLAGLMRDVYRAWKSELLDRHIDDIACAAYSKGAFLALEPGAAVSWMVHPESPCCSECEDNSLAGELVKGDAFPTGDVIAPAHPGCRCLVRPVRH